MSDNIGNITILRPGTTYYPTGDVKLVPVFEQDNRGYQNEIYTYYDITLEDMLSIQMQCSPQKWVDKDNPFDDANREETLNYLDPNNYNTGNYRYQFLDLSAYAGISELEMAAFLRGKGILNGTAHTFLDAANKYGVSEAYLAAHASHETGSGTSPLARGIDVDGVIYYNMYGIGAYDYDPEGTGSKFAAGQGWDSPEKAIDDGARWISERYINNSSYKQNTLYKMRWNPANPGTHQYATDIGWAVNQTPVIKGFYDQFPSANLSFDFPVYLN